jgi:hypothetical protein
MASFDLLLVWWPVAFFFRREGIATTVAHLRPRIAWHRIPVIHRRALVDGKRVRLQYSSRRPQLEPIL